MSGSLTWQLLRPEHVDRVMAVSEIAAVRDLLLEADRDSSAGYFAGPPAPPDTAEVTNAAAGPPPQQQQQQQQQQQHQIQQQQQMQRDVLLDMLFHVVRFAKAQRFAPAKLSTVVSLAHELHRRSMAAKANAQEALTILEHLLVQHSTHRPPFFAAVFTPLEATAISEYMLSTYLRQYKLYLNAFARRSELRVSCRALGAVNEALPVGAAAVPPLQRAVPLQQWEAAAAEKARLAAAEAEAAAAAEAAAWEAAEQRRADEAAAPPIPAGLRAQLDLIRSAVSQSSTSQLLEVEARVAMLEARVASEQKPSTAGKSSSRQSRK